jgi:enterochelin esterase family protein
MPLEEMIIDSADADYSRSAWLVEGPETEHPLCIFLDGEHYRDSIEPLPILARLADSGLVPRMTAVFVSHGGAAARHTDYVRSPSFARFIAEDVVAEVRKRAPAVAAEGHLICGLSLSGLAAAHIALTYPSLFPAALCQSGSFWYDPDGFTRLVQELPPAKTRLYLSVGDEETDVDVSHPPTGLYQGISQIEGVDRARAALDDNGREVKFHRFRGGHDFEPWRAELGDALQWLLRSP